MSWLLYDPRKLLMLLGVRTAIVDFSFDYSERIADNGFILLL